MQVVLSREIGHLVTSTQCNRALRSDPASLIFTRNDVTLYAQKMTTLGSWRSKVTTKNQYDLSDECSHQNYRHRINNSIFPTLQELTVGATNCGTIKSVSQ